MRKNRRDDQWEAHVGMKARWTGGLLLLAAAAMPGMAAAQGSKVSSAVELVQKADALKPGDWVWAPEVAPAGPMLVYVDLSRQLATVYRNGVRIGVSTVSSGKAGHETPDGVFTILQKDAAHHSSKYNNAAMPFQQRLTWDGVALHAGGLPGYPESHGCVHLPYAFAKLLFGVTDLGGTVVVAGSAGSAVHVQDAGVLAASSVAKADGRSKPLSPNESYRWTPEASPAGPVSVILSKSDQRAIVLRNGIEIGRARITIPDQDFATHVLTLTRNAQGGESWIYVGVPGHAGEVGRVLDSAVMARVEAPHGFMAAIRTVLAPGATVLVTQSRVNGATTGTRLAVMSGTDGPEPISTP
ncbi:L,D-transpeptidase [Sphingomonas sp. DBB INV C78]|uniref:L,D-transpeptidase n=1 Tax=Sphingomonas sp. DBB INV C78 TaxID=3349434 RepID=UPI0036D411C8